MGVFTLASLYSSSGSGLFVDGYGHPLTRLPVTLKDPNGPQLAPCWTDETMTVPAANPFTTGDDGSFAVWVTPGTWQPVVYGVELAQVVVPPNQVTASVAQQLVGAAVSSLPGKLADAAADAAIVAKFTTADLTSSAALAIQQRTAVGLAEITAGLWDLMTVLGMAPERPQETITIPMTGTIPAAGGVAITTPIPASGTITAFGYVTAKATVI